MSTPRRRIRPALRRAVFLATGCGVVLMHGRATNADEPRSTPSRNANQPPRDYERMASSRVLVHFRLKPGSDPLTAIDLYYLRDEAEGWQKAEHISTTSSPVTFDAPGDGLYGLYLVFHTSSGASALPATGTAPQRWIRVDRTAPVVQLLSLKPDRRFNLNRGIKLRWRLEDEDPMNRPVSIRYRAEGMKSFELMADSLPADGEYQWTVPEGVTGRVELKLTGLDQSGNRGEYNDARLTIEDDSVSVSADARDMAGHGPNEADTTASGAVDREDERNSQERGLLEAPSFSSEPDAGEAMGDTGAAKEAKRLYDLATWHRLRGEADVAIARYEDALRQRPDFVSARNDLAAMWSLKGELDQAAAEYSRVLATDGRHRSALKGLAYVQARQGNFRSAHATLQKLLLVDPLDAETWLNLGDVCLFIGDRSAARDAWTKVLTLKAVTRDVQRRAEKRLKIYRPEGVSLGEAFEE